ncbi:hypothetical protein HanPSC8_Chr12g0521261 [Helianthus annuus]|nr:hypothetical protein HanPSC8_Chr12g0521261 [Helianthus annuus]
MFRLEPSKFYSSLRFIIFDLLSLLNNFSRFHFCATSYSYFSYDYTLLACMISRNFTYAFITTSRDISSR